MSIDHAAHVMMVYRRATDADRAHGMGWYAMAHDIAREARTVPMGAGILSALSPRMPWVRNVQLARVAFTTPLTGGGLTRSIENARRILAGEDPMDVLGGMKTRAFFTNILDPDDDWTVTVDTHAIKIAGIPNRDSVGKGLYMAIADGYREAAEYVGILPQQMQAITWTTYRREQGIV